MKCRGGFDGGKLSFHTASRLSQPALTLSVPLSRFTPRVGGGSALRWATTSLHKLKHTKPMDKETKDVIKPLIENLALIAEKQALILELLATKHPISDAQRTQLLASAQENRKHVETWRQSLLTWK